MTQLHAASITPINRSRFRARTENRQLKAHNVQLRARLDRTFRQLNEMENQQNQGAILQERMRERIKQMDTHSLHTSSQVCNVFQVKGVRSCFA